MTAAICMFFLWLIVKAFLAHRQTVMATKLLREESNQARLLIASAIQPTTRQKPLDVRPARRRDGKL